MLKSMFLSPVFTWNIYEYDFIYFKAMLFYTSQHNGSFFPACVLESFIRLSLPGMYIPENFDNHSCSFNPETRRGFMVLVQRKFFCFCLLRVIIALDYHARISSDIEFRCT